jgi:hypothetical protein
MGFCLSGDASKGLSSCMKPSNTNWCQASLLFLVPFLVVFVISCTSESNPPPPSGAAHQEVNSVAQGFTQANSMSEDELSSSLLNTKLSDKSAQSGIESIYADTDGDQIPEHIAICDRTKVCINHPLSNSTNIYSQPSWAGVYLTAVVDTDGEPGEEVIVLATNRDGQLACICLVHDSTGTVETYSNPFWYSASIVSITDTDGEPGEDIVFIAHDEQGAFACICVVHDQQHDYKVYADPAWATVRIEWIEDTDAQPGKEIIAEVRGTRDDFRCFCVIHDRPGSMTAYSKPAWEAGAIYKVADTDGNAGEDIIISYTATPGGGVSVIHDMSQEVSMYSFSGAPSTIQRFANSDKTKGSELCIQLGQEKGYVMIKDKSRESFLAETCTSQLLKALL